MLELNSITLLLSMILCNCTPQESVQASSDAVSLKVLSTVSHGSFGEASAEIVAHDSQGQRLFVVNKLGRIDVLDVKDPSKPRALPAIDLKSDGGGPTSVAARGDVLAISIPAKDRTQPGKVLICSTNGQRIREITVGANPDMLTFTPDGNTLLVANEGEPSDDYKVDPEGSVSLIDVSKDLSKSGPEIVRTADFRRFNSEKLDPRIRVFGPGATAAQDFEPEYIGVAADSKTAWVPLQENNALAVLDVATAKIVRLIALGEKDYQKEGAGLDASDKDDAIHIASWPVLGMYQPDSIAVLRMGDVDYLVTANEGDSRDYPGFSEEIRVSKANLGPGLPKDLAEDSKLGRMQVTTSFCKEDKRMDEIHSFGARSFSIWSTDGAQLFDSGQDFERITAERFPKQFNCDNEENGSFDQRSDAKGPEPEGLAIGRVNDRVLAFIGLERISGVMVYDISDPRAAKFAGYVNPRKFDGDVKAGTAGDLGPEGLIFIAPSQSPNGKPLLVVANEISATTTIYEVALHEVKSGSK